MRTIQESSESRGVAWAVGSTGYCRVSFSKSSAMRLTCISLAQLFAHCSQAVGGGCSWDVGENGGGGEDGGKGNEHGSDNGGDISSLLSVSPLLLCRLYCCTIVIVFLVTIVSRYVVMMPLLSCAL